MEFICNTNCTVELFDIIGIIHWSDFTYYGEMITYLGMTMPMAIFALIAWLKNPYNGNRAEVKVNNIDKRETMFMWIATIIIAFMFYLYILLLEEVHILHWLMRQMILHS